MKAIVTLGTIRTIGITTTIFIYFEAKKAFFTAETETYFRSSFERLLSFCFSC